MLNLEIDAFLKQGDFALDISTTINRDTAGIFGPSGSGKSTLLHLISGLRKPERGRIVLNDTVFFDSKKKIYLPPEKRNIGVVFQDGKLFPHMTVEKNLMFGARRRGKDAPEVHSVINILNLNKLLKRYPEHLSGGERQRVAIGRALLSGPQLLLLDEPFSAIDINMRRELLPFISRLHAEFDLPIMIISHDLPDILQLTDYLLLIRNGELLAKGDCAELAFKQDCSHILTSAGIRSCFNGNVCQTSADTGITTICHCTGPEPVHIYAPYQANLEVGESVRAQITPQDIILSAAPVEYISAQNQLKGIISRISNLGEKTMIEVDVSGLKLMAEITTKASQDFPYHKGANIWVLFKAWAVNCNPCKDTSGKPFKKPCSEDKTCTQSSTEKSARFFTPPR